ncbi:MAG: helix-hairpin-helix domain-containing protein [Bacteroidetes bacterium]|nr:helix-hairpin-helix domain-containing protein [Bacteroidota bacterium]
MRKLVTCLFLSIAIEMSAQTDTLPVLQTGEDLLESYSRGQEEDASFDYNDLFDRLVYLRRRPLDLNEATENDLADFPFLTDIQRTALLEYRRTTGDLVSLYELQAVPGFDLATIRALLPYVRVDEPGIFGQNQAAISPNRQQVLLRWSRQLEEKRGFQTPEDTAASRYLGSPDQLYLRYRFTKSDRMSAGFTAEKDAGEQFFKGSNRRGFDFYSAHFFIKNPVKRVKAVALGDYAVSMGQGLLVYQGFAPRKSALTTSVSRNGRSLRPFTSVSEFDFFRGAAAIFDLGKNMELLAFGSTRRRDANLDERQDTIPGEPDLTYVTSLQTSGLHRTPSEIDDEGAIRQNSAGATLKFRKRSLHFALNSLYEHLDKPLERSPALYNRYYFNGQRLLNLSADYGFALRNFYFFGETARSQNGAVSTLNGFVASLDRQVEVAVVNRHFPKEYQSLNPKPFAESSGAANERGTYLGLQVLPSKRWRFNAYFDQYRHEWPKFGADAPSSGQEWLARLTFTLKRKMETYVQIRQETKEENGSGEGKVDVLVPRKNLQARLHFSYKLSPGLEWRSRLDLGFSKMERETLEGVALFQELIFSPLGSPFTASTRFAIFDTDDYAVRFYSYEWDVLNDFSIPAYYGRGTRFYLNFGWRLSSRFRLELRYATTYFPNVEEVGSGLEETIGPRKSEVKLQLRFEL